MNNKERVYEIKPKPVECAGNYFRSFLELRWYLAIEFNNKHRPDYKNVHFSESEYPHLHLEYEPKRFITDGYLPDFFVKLRYCNCKWTDRCNCKPLETLSDYQEYVFEFILEIKATEPTETEILKLKRVHEKFNIPCFFGVGYPIFPKKVENFGRWAYAEHPKVQYNFSKVSFCNKEGWWSYGDAMTTLECALQEGRLLY